MTTQKQITEFFESQPIALVGASRNPKKFGYAAYKELKDKGLKVVPVNSEADLIMGDKTYRNITSLPAEIKGVIIVTNKSHTASVVKEAIDRGIKQIWIQQNSDSAEALKQLQGSEINYITGECILMHFKPNGIHSFHRAIKKFFGRLPK